MTEDKFEALINGQKIPRERLAEMFDELTETCYEKTKHYRKFEGTESALEWEEMEELLRRIQATKGRYATIPMKKIESKPQSYSPSPWPRPRHGDRSGIGDSFPCKSRRIDDDEGMFAFFCWLAPDAVPDGADGFVPFTNSRVLPDVTQAFSVRLSCDRSFRDPCDPGVNLSVLEITACVSRTNISES